MRLKKAVLIVLAVIFTLAAAELLLQLLTPNVIYSPLSNQTYDRRLGTKMNPALEDIDDKGFRNPAPLDHADIVTLGDSHTYGVNVSSAMSWPQQLADMDGVTVYNLGVGSYGTLQYSYLVDEAIKMKPKHIVLALYVTNDLDDVCKLINRTNYWDDWLRERGYDPSVCRETSGVWRTLKHYLTKSNLYWIIASAVKRAYEGRDLGDSVVVREEANHTIMKHKSISNHKRKMDMSRERIALGFEITKGVIADIEEKCDEAGIDFSIVFIPSKSRAFFEYLNSHGYELSDDYYQLVENENDLVARFSEFFDELGIEHVDAGPYVLEELYTSSNVYSPTDDGHPLESGYKGYARAAHDAVRIDLNAVSKPGDAEGDMVR